MRYMQGANHRCNLLADGVMSCAMYDRFRESRSRDVQELRWLCRKCEISTAAARDDSGGDFWCEHMIQNATLSFEGLYQHALLHPKIFADVGIDLGMRNLA